MEMKSLVEECLEKSGVFVNFAGYCDLLQQCCSIGQHRLNNEAA